MTTNFEPFLTIGILHAPAISFRLDGPFSCGENGFTYETEQVIEFCNGKLLFNGDVFDELFLFPQQKDCTFLLDHVTIGIGFHWNRQEQQRFEGILRFIVDENQVCAVNIINVEKYLTSVISSEMAATSSKELLKAHSVISRSWLLAQLDKKEKNSSTVSETSDEKEIIKWYDRDDHLKFDVCADDHCQRYQGVTKITSSLVKECINLTRGEVILYENKICDARFSKCCGGISERFSNCWQDTDFKYLTPVYDHSDGMDSEQLPSDLTIESNARAWIKNSPKAFCNTHDKRILSQVLNNYDQETADFYRWKVIYSQDEIAEIIKDRTGIDFGKIISLEPLKRGESGRITKLKISGTKKTMIIGKELEIRKTLSKTHLYSSAFVVDIKIGEDNLPSEFILTGAGWGHGVGLCQIGAAVMSESGYTYQQILLHYFRGSSITKIYQ